MMTQDKIDHYVEVLQEKHAALDKQIEENYKNYQDDLELEALKKQKLWVKDLISSLTK